VLTAEDMPAFPRLEPPSAVTVMPFTGDEIRYEGQPVALVLAESVEAAEAARPAVAVDCERADPVLLGAGRREPAQGENPVFDKGDVDAARARAAVRVEQTYRQPARHHNAMETSGTVARWDGDRLTLWDAVQAGSTVLPVVGRALGVDAGSIRVVARHTGGGFGGKGFVWPHEILAAAAARVAGRPVKLHLRRSDQFSSVGYQPWMEQTVRLAADADGVLLGVEHESVNNAGLVDTHVEPATEASRSLYAAPSIRLSLLVERVSLNVPTPMRAPVEGPGLWALESAMNELADAVGVDPLDLRLRNFADVSPADGRPWSSNRLREAYEEGARRYGWRDRHRRPREDGPWRIGHGMATCSMGSFRFPGAARVRLSRDGLVVEANVHDIGTGAQTALAQIAAEELGVPLDRVETRWGDTDLPRTGPTYGSSTTMGTGSAVASAARDVAKQLADRGLTGDDPFAAVAGADLDELVGEGTFALPGGAQFNGDGEGTPHAIRTWGAIFVEVGVDPDFGLLRLRRAVGAYSAGRIINPLTARAQMTGAIIWGWGKATMEESDQEPVHGRWLAKNLSNVAVPVNADVPSDLDVSFVEEFDESASLIGARGIGELGATGVDAAVAAAVHDAVGVRVRDLPILPWKVLGEW
jgi:xanthine dehydrogenase YagR molybdenum-binding subunit